MTDILIFFGAALVVVGIVVLVWRRARVKWLARERIEISAEASGPALEEPRPATRSFGRRHRFLPWLTGLLAAALVHFCLGWAPAFVVAVFLIVGLLGIQLESYLASKSSLRMETQLADAIDLMVGALRAGASVGDALDGAMRESRNPLRGHLEDMIGRIRLGDDPPTVYRNLAESVPLETFLLFASALSVQWETGGSLAPSLASVGRTIRDRIEISRRIRSNSTQTQASSMAVLLLTYFIALVMWRTNPRQFHEFLVTTSGQWLVAATILLQAVGLGWMALLSRLRF